MAVQPSSAPLVSARMRVLSVKQPFAQLIVRGLNKWELRRWTTDHRGQMAIHASSAVPSHAVIADALRDSALKALFASQSWIDREDLLLLPRSAVVGVVELVRVVSVQEWRDD